MKQPFPPRLTINYVLAGASLGVVLLHGILSLRYPQQEWVTPVIWIALYALGIAVTLVQSRKATPLARWRWRLININFTFAICGFLAILYGEYITRYSPEAAWLNDLLRAFRGLPFLLAVCTPEEVDRHVKRLIDILQVLLIAGIFLVLFTPGLFAHPVGLAPLQAARFNLYSYSQSILLALLALLAVFTAKTAESRHFHLVIALYLWIGTPIALWTNHILINTWSVPPASVLFLPSDLCLLVFAFAVPLLRYRVRPQEPGPVLVFLRLGASAFLPLFAILASMILATAGHHVLLGVLASLLSLTLYGLRSSYGQFQLMSTQWDLQLANERLEELSQHDALTGIYNRRWFAEAFTSEWKRAQRSLQPLSLLLIDVDHFKLYNDSLGHVEGDRCLQIVAKLLEEQLCRSTDALARYGGEEFVAMLPNTSQEGANRVASRMMESLAKLDLPHIASPFGAVTVSIGGATWQGNDNFQSPDLTNQITPEKIFLTVDTALYEAKSLGRNCIRLKQIPTVLTPI